MDEKNYRDINLFIGSKIKAKRVALGITQNKLGEKLGIAFQQVQKYEKGRNRINMEKLLKIAKIFDVSILYFLKGYDEYVKVQNKNMADDTKQDAKKSKKADKELCRVIELFGMIEDAKTRKIVVKMLEKLV